jgi:hypothetical protein
MPSERVNWKHLAIAVIVAGGGGIGGAKILHGDQAQASPAPAAAQLSPEAIAAAVAKAVSRGDASDQRPVLDAITAMRSDVQAIRDEVKGVRTEALQSASSLRVEIQAQAVRIDRVLEKVGK